MNQAQSVAAVPVVRRGAKPLELMPGQRFGRWTVIGRGERNDNCNWFWLCRCDCGIERPVRGTYLNKGLSRSCGCVRAEKVAKITYRGVRATHGRSGTAEFRIWAAMLTRCTNKNSSGWPYYGGRGIKVCERWRESFADFFADMGERPTPKHTIDRINNEGDYEPGNCRWATMAEQNKNKRPRKDSRK